jgi:acyl-homoserine-lactone acylase
MAAGWVAGAGAGAAILALSLVSAVSAQPPAPSYRARVEIRRTSFGVPHILAEDLGAAGYGLAWAQLEDHGVRVAMNLVRARGQLARHFGRDSLESDVLNRQTHRQASAAYLELEPETRDLFEGFAAAVNRYVARHRTEFPPWMPRDFTGRDVAALWVGSPFGETELFQSRLRRRALARRDSLGRLGSGSNAWSLAPSRTTSGHAILLRNPHLNWNAGYYEAHVTVPGVIDFYGDFRVGYPLYFNGGFNEHLGWATTNNSADRDEIYALKADPAHPDRYSFDGASVALTADTVLVRVRSGASLVTERRVVWRSSLGPVVARSADTIYVVKSPNDGNVKKAEQFLRMMRARTLEEWKAALQLRAQTESNLTYADRAGNIFYIWNAAIPERPHASGGDTAAVPASTAADVWSRLVPLERLPQVLNPPGGYVQNSNDPFHFTNLVVPLDSAAYPPDFPRPALGFRSQLSLALVTEREKVSLEDVVRLKHSPRMLAAERLKDDLIAAVRAGSSDAEVLRAVELLERWDNTVSPAARGGVLFEAWFSRYLAGEDPNGRASGVERWRAAFAQPWSAAEPTTTPDGLADPPAAVRAFAWAVRETRRLYGRWDAAWGEVHRIRRGRVDLPANGCPGILGCFRVLWYDSTAHRQRVATGGDGWVLAVEFGPTPRAYSVLAYGQSSRPDSPHYADQAARFARGDLKRVAFTEAEIARDLVRRYRPR